jgi:hypothetical protein
MFDDAEKAENSRKMEFLTYSWTFTLQLSMVLSQ